MVIGSGAAGNAASAFGPERPLGRPMRALPRAWRVGSGGMLSGPGSGATAPSARPLSGQPLLHVPPGVATRNRPADHPPGPHPPCHLRGVRAGDTSVPAPLGGGRAYGVRGCDRRDDSGSPHGMQEKKVLTGRRWRSSAGRPGAWTRERTPGPRAPRTRQRTPALAGRTAQRASAPARNETAPPRS